MDVQQSKGATSAIEPQKFKIRTIKIRKLLPFFIYPNGLVPFRISFTSFVFKSLIINFLPTCLPKFFFVFMGGLVANAFEHFEDSSQVRD